MINELTLLVSSIAALFGVRALLMNRESALLKRQELLVSEFGSLIAYSKDLDNYLRNDAYAGMSYKELYFSIFSLKGAEVYHSNPSCVFMKEDGLMEKIFLYIYYNFAFMKRPQKKLNELKELVGTVRREINIINNIIKDWKKHSKCECINQDNLESLRREMQKVLIGVGDILANWCSQQIESHTNK